MKLRSTAILSLVSLLTAFTLFAVAVTVPQIATAQTAEDNANAVVIIDCRRTESSGPTVLPP